MSDLIDRQAAIETVRKAKSKGEAHRMRRKDFCSRGERKDGEQA